MPLPSCWCTVTVKLLVYGHCQVVSVLSLTSFQGTSAVRLLVYCQVVSVLS